MATTGSRAGPDGRPRPLWQAILGWCLVTGLIALQFALFRRHALREVVWAYPDHYDQAYYLGQAYTLYERFRTAGVWPGLTEHLATPRPQGILFPVPAALLFLLVGPSRLAALSVGLAHFALLQVLLVGTLRWLTRRWSVALLGLGLLLAAATPFTANGGLLDYRIDFTACCLFGVVLCLVVRSRLFASRRWSAAAGIACAGLILFRFLTLAYLGGIAALVLLFLLARCWRGRPDPERRRLAARQLGGLALAGSVALATAGPLLWINRQAIYAYYIIGHFNSPQKHIRALGHGTVDVVGQLFFYPRTVATAHLGATFAVLTGAVLVLAVGLGLARRLARPQAAAERADWAGTGFFLLCCLAVPYGLLTLDQAKSWEACNILVPPVLWLVLLAAAAVSRVRPADLAPRLRTAAFAALAAAVLAGGIFAQVRSYRRHSYFTQHRPDVEEVTRLFDLVEQHCRRTHYLTPHVAVTSNAADYLTPVIIPAFLYERHGVLIRPSVGSLGGTIYEVSAAEALADLQKSDVVLLADPAGVRSPYPFDRCMKDLYPELKRYCDYNLWPARRSHLFHQDVTLYVRPPASE
jgi:hypothetical protein